MDPVDFQEEIKETIGYADGEIFRLLVSSVRDYAIFVLSTDGNVVTWNEGAENINGYTANEIIGKHFSVFYTDEANASNHPADELKMAVQNGRYEEEGLRVRKDGSTFWASVVVTPLYTDDKLVGFAKVTRDLTERRKAQQIQEAHSKQITATNEELQRLAYVVSHELQAPISTISRYGNLLSVRYKDRLGQDADDFIDKITTSTQLIGRMIDDLWLYARVNKPYIDRETVYMGNVFDNAVLELTEVIGDNPTKRGEMPTIEGNKQQLVFLFKEIIKNAYMYRSSRTPEVSIEAVKDKNGWIFAVKDNGIGIDMVRSNEVFTLFHRLDGGPEASATGMGLSICKRIVDQHQGRIWLESKLGQGTTFFVWLPERY